MDTFIPPFDQGIWSPDKSDLTRWYYELAKYLKEHPIPGDDTLGALIDQYLTEHPIGEDLYGPDNPPPYPVTSVNGQTGAVVIEAGSGGDPNAYSPTNPPPYPVTSVNGQTGVVQVLEADVIASGQSPAPSTKIFVDEGENYPQQELDILDRVYPVGSIYMSVNSASPATLFGGTWAAIEGRFLLAAGGGYAAGSEGGEAAHKLTASELPSKGLKIGLDSNGSETRSAFLWGLSNKATWYNDNLGEFIRGGDEAHNNMPPYLAVYIWQRTA